MSQRISSCLLFVGMVQLLATCTSDKPLVMSSRDEAAPEIVRPDYLKPSHDLQSVPTDISWTRFERKHARQHISSVTFEDFDNDGDKDAFVTYVETADISKCPPKASYCHKPTEPRVYENVRNEDMEARSASGSSSFRARPLHGFLHNTEKFFAGEVPQVINVRKALTGDYNGDGRPDLFLATHGPAVPPLDRETAPMLLLSSNDGLIESGDLRDLVGYNHAAASADIDNDGDLDILVSDSMNRSTYFLLNDGRGSFSRSARHVPSELKRQPPTTMELVDVDGDGNIDLLVGGKESRTLLSIYWGSRNGRFSSSRKTVLPPVDEYSIVVDIDVGDLDENGSRDIVVSRTRSDPRYKGYYVQFVSGSGNRKFLDQTARRVDAARNDSGRWIQWLRLMDVNNDGHLDIQRQDSHDRDLAWINDGNGNFGVAKEP